MTVSALEAYVNKIEGEHRAAFANLQDQFDTLAAAHAGALDVIQRQAIALDEVRRKIDPRVAPDLVEFAKFVLPTENAPARRLFDAAGLLGSIAERSRV